MSKRGFQLCSRSDRLLDRRCIRIGKSWMSCKSLFRNPKQEYSVVGRSRTSSLNCLNIDYFDLSNKTLHVSYTGLYQVWHILCLDQSGAFVHIWTKISKKPGGCLQALPLPLLPSPSPLFSPVPSPPPPLRAATQARWNGISQALWL